VRQPAAPEDPRFREAAELLDEGAVDGAYSAAVLLVGLGEDVAWERSAGHARAASLFDIASVTKPLTAALFFILSQEGHLRPDSPAADVLPFTSPDPRVREIRFSHLLAHTSGLPAYLPLYERILEAERATTGSSPRFFPSPSRTNREARGRTATSGTCSWAGRSRSRDSSRSTAS
jgi:CubicO group peptidase (beta-lactamase class C family)